MRLRIISFLAVVILSIVTVNSYAQTMWEPDLGEKNLISVEWVKPELGTYLDGNDEVSFFSSVAFIQGFVPIKNRFAVVADIPISHWGLNDGDGIDTQAPHTTIGNIYIGGHYRFNEIMDAFTPSVEIGTRLPTMPDPEHPDKLGASTGSVASIDRREAFRTDILPIITVMNLDYSINDVALLRVRGGGSYWIDRDSFYQQNQFYLIQNVQLHFSTPELGGNLGFSGKYNIAPVDASLSKDDVTQIRAGVTKSFDALDVELFARTPIKNSYLEVAFGVKAKVQF